MMIFMMLGYLANPFAYGLQTHLPMDYSNIIFSFINNSPWAIWMNAQQRLVANPITGED